MPTTHVLNILSLLFSQDKYEMRSVNDIDLDLIPIGIFRLQWYDGS
jgi:hypothetical protein